MLTKTLLVDKRKRRTWFFVGSIIWTIVILGLSVMPSHSIPSVKIPYIDKIVHFTMFMVYGFLASGTIHKDKNNFFRFFLLFMCLFAFGIIMEVIQGSVPGRSPDFVDAVYNGIGILLGITNFLVIQRKFFQS